MTRRHPYIGLPDNQFWKKEPAIEEPELFDPVSPPPFKICREDPVVTAGSCFAQHVARHLARSGFNHLITEQPHPVFSDEIAAAFNYGMFAARYGNIYTARQLKQLLLRAYGMFEPVEAFWIRDNDRRVVDPFRPQIQPDGFISAAELAADREQHFTAIRQAIEEMSVFVFTLGLTESWVDNRDGAVFPLAPGVAGGTYDPEKHTFQNFTVSETLEDLEFALRLIREKNPSSRIILTVSPVPLNATMIDRHVFVSTTWSKAVLRLAAEEAQMSLEQCAYFPSYEIINNPYIRGAYFGPDCRSVTEEGVAHVMRLFLAHYGEGEASLPISSTVSRHDTVREHMIEMENLAAALCDEEAIDNS